MPHDILLGVLLSQFSYDLPAELIAQTPAKRRDASRLLRLNRIDSQIDHHHFYDLPTLLRPGDLLVLNDTKVLPVRLLGRKSSGGQVEVLLTKRVELNTDHEIWEALTKPGLKVGQIVVIERDHQPLQLKCVADQGYTRLVQTSAAGGKLLALLDRLGTLPLPPYIHDFAGDPARYQTVFAQAPGSAAAPTAGLHFTPALFDQLAAAGVCTTKITLHVGLGTFLPVKEKEIEKHQMHSEYYEIPNVAALAVNQAKKEGRRVVAVGTTALRTLESVADQDGLIKPGSGETSLFVYPPYRFRCANALITNFHLPESTLLMLVAAFTSWPQTKTRFTDFSASALGQAYQLAIEQRYRFFSFGDAMLIE